MALPVIGILLVKRTRPLQKAVIVLGVIKRVRMALSLVLRSQVILRMIDEYGVSME
jgi:hypothetical protein